MNRLAILVFILLALFGCRKSNDPSPYDPDPDPVFQIPEVDDMVMYEVNLRAFSAQGGFSGVTQRLGQLQKLGVNVIWIMPIHPIGTVNSVNSPYSVQDYAEVSPEYGTLDDLQDLVKQAHQRDMAVIMDWVANHTAWDHPWIVNKDWYTQDNNGNIIHPPGTNWLDVADLNYDNTEMRDQMIAAMQYWIDEADIDGFRCDAADMIPFDFWEQAISSLNLITEKDLVWLAEGARNDHFTAGFDMNFSWDFYGKLKDLYNGTATTAQLYNVHRLSYNAVPDGKQKLRFTTNHDESAWDATPMVIFNGQQGALSASVITTFLGGVPLIYTGQETGRVENVPFFSNSPINWDQNPGMTEAYEKIMDSYLANNAARSGSLTHYSDAQVMSFTRENDAEIVFILVNPKNETVTYAVPEGFSGQAWLDEMEGNTVTLDNDIELPAYGYLILTRLKS